MNHRRQFSALRHGYAVRCSCGWGGYAWDGLHRAAMEWEAHRDGARLDDKIRLGAVRVQVNVKEAQASEVFARFERNLREAFRREGEQPT